MAGSRGRAPLLTPTLVLLLLLAAVFTAAARSPETAVPTMTFRGPHGTLHHAGPRIQRPPAIVPLGHWSYPLLGRLATRGIIDLDLTTLPVSRREVLDALLELDPVLTGRADGHASLDCCQAADRSHALAQPGLLVLGAFTRLDFSDFRAS